MQQFRFRSILAGAGLMAWALVAPLAGQKAALAAAARPAQGGLHTGIRVHGRWTIVVRNPDGSVAARRQFENTLQADGDVLLPLLLTGQIVPGSWEVALGGDASSAGPCGTSTGFAVPGAVYKGTVLPNPCISAEPAPSGVGCKLAGAECQPTLSVTVVQTSSLGQNPAWPVLALQLSGTAYVSQGGSLAGAGTIVTACNTGTEINSVASYPALAAASVLPSACASETGAGLTGSPGGTLLWLLTETTIPGGPITVVAKQTVQVTVVISFS